MTGRRFDSSFPGIVSGASVRRPALGVCQVQQAPGSVIVEALSRFVELKLPDVGEDLAEHAKVVILAEAEAPALPCLTRLLVSWVVTKELPGRRDKKNAQV